MSDKVTLKWTVETALKWTDFCAESNPAVFEDSHGVIKYGFTWTVNSDMVDGRIVFLIEDISISSEFHPLLSWVRHPAASASLLNYEQGHFDLAELVRRENISNLRQKFYNRPFLTRGRNEEQRKQFAREDSGRMIHDEVDKLQLLFEQRSSDYQTETCHGQNADQQAEYDLLFGALRQ